MTTEDPKPRRVRRHQSEQIDKLAAALCQAQSDFPAVKAATQGRDGNRRYHYADLADYIAACKPFLKPNGLSYTQIPTEDDEGGVTVETMVMHESGQYIAGTLSMPVDENQRTNAKARGSAITYARRYSFAMMFGLAPTEDDDATAASSSAPAAEPPPGDGIIREIIELWQSLKRTPEELGELLKKQEVSKLSELDRSSLVSLRDRLTVLDGKKQAAERF